MKPGPGVYEKLSENKALAQRLARDELAFRASLVEHRELSGLSRADVAEKLCTTEAFVADFERFAHNPTLAEIRYYAWAIGVYFDFGINFAEELPRQRHLVDVTHVKPGTVLQMRQSGAVPNPKFLAAVERVAKARRATT